MNSTCTGINYRIICLFGPCLCLCLMVTHALFTHHVPTSYCSLSTTRLCFSVCATFRVEYYPTSFHKWFFSLTWNLIYVAYSEKKYCLHQSQNECIVLINCNSAKKKSLSSCLFQLSFVFFNISIEEQRYCVFAHLLCRLYLDNDDLFIITSEEMSEISESPKENINSSLKQQFHILM